MKESIYNTTYTDQMYHMERKFYFDTSEKNPLRQLSVDFCIRFIEKLPDENDPNLIENSRYGKKCTGDGDDYFAWGYALHDAWIEDEEGGREVLGWVEFYAGWIETVYGHHQALDDPKKYFTTPAKLAEAMTDLI